MFFTCIKRDVCPKTEAVAKNGRIETSGVVCLNNSNLTMPAPGSPGPQYKSVVVPHLAVKRGKGWDSPNEVAVALAAQRMVARVIC